MKGFVSGAIVCLLLGLGGVATGYAGIAVPGSEAEEGDKSGEGGFSITSPAFDHEGAIPARYTCTGEDVSPALAWSKVPEGTRSLALVVYDPDAPDPENPKRTWVHWVLYDLPPTSEGLPRGVQPGDLPEGTRQGENDWGRTGYGGPCPPVGRHRYFHALYALDTELPDLDEPTRDELKKAMKGHVLEKAVLMGTYEKP